MTSEQDLRPVRGLVDIVRDFLGVQRAFAELGARFRAAELRFADIESLVGDGEESLLFRLKERCHALFRQPEGSGVGRGALFDLAVGALFHEAMRLREMLYQQSVYGPKMRALRRSSDPDNDGLFRAFESILEVGATRLAETFQEVDTLIEQTRVEFRALLRAHREDGLVARFLTSQADLVEGGFAAPLDEVLASIHGTAAAAHRIAARSYLESGYFGRAAESFARAARESGSNPESERLHAYAQGMEAYLEGRYGEMVESLDRWLASGSCQGEDALAELAFAAVSRVEQLVEHGSAVVAPAAVLAERLRSHAPRARAAEIPLTREES